MLLGTASSAVGKGTCQKGVLQRDHGEWPQQLVTCPPMQPAALMHLETLQAALLVPCQHPDHQQECAACITSGTRDGHVELYGQALFALPTHTCCPVVVLSRE